MGSWDYDIEEVLGDDGATVGSLVVRFTLPEDVTSAAGLELLCQPEEAQPDGTAGGGGVDGGCSPPATGYALVIKSADRRGARTPSLSSAAPLDAWLRALSCRATRQAEETSRRCSCCAGFFTCCAGCVRRGDATGMPRGAAV